MKRLIYRFAVWLEYRALDLQDWAAPTPLGLDLHDVVVGAINHDPMPFWQNNALMMRLSKEAKNERDD